MTLFFFHCRVLFVWMFYHSFNQAPVGGHVGHSEPFTVTNNVVLNNLVLVSAPLCIHGGIFVR